MGNIYSILDLKHDDDKTTIIQNEILELERNIKNIDHMLKVLSNKCDTILTKIITVDNKTYELIETSNKTNNLNEFGNEWDYYDFKQTIELTPNKVKVD